MIVNREALERRKELPIWMRLTELHAAIDRGRQEVLWEGSLGGHEPFRVLDRKGALLWDEQNLHRRTDYVLGWVRDTLQLREAEGWGQLSSTFLADLIRGFYAEAGDWIGFVFVESSRMLLRNTLGSSYQENLQLGSRPACLPRQRLLKLPEVKLPLGGVRFASLPERPLRTARLVRMAIERTYTPTGQGVPLSGRWTCWCHALPEEDGAFLRRALVPAARQCFLPTGINGARIISLAKLHPRTGFTYSYAVDLDPLTGQIISLRRAFAPLRLLTEITPHYNRVLLAGVNGRSASS